MEITGSGRLLIVDDSDSNRDMLGRRLARHGYETTLVSSGHAALEQIAENSFDLVLLDIDMPEMSGMEVLKSIRTEYSASDLPVIMVTALSDTADIVFALHSGANDYITKPVDFPVARARIQTHVSLKRAVELRRESEDRYALAVTGANDGIWDWNLRNGEIFYSSRWKAMLGHSEYSLISKPEEWLSRIHPEDRSQMDRDLQAHLDGIDPHFENEHRMLHRDGTYHWMLSRGMALRDSSGKAHRIAGSQTDITPGKVSDPLTRLPNRVLFMDRLGRLAERAKRFPSSAFAVLFVDIDHFKLINDSLGHLAGDQLLIAIAQRLERNLRASDTVSRVGEGTLARFGGDEFAILLDDVKTAEDAIQAGERLIGSLSESFHIAGREVFTSASIGIVLSITGFENPNDLIRDADTAMYQAKALGRGRIEVFEPSMRDSTVARLILETDLRQGVDKNQFMNWYQLIVSLESGAIIGFEALVRWQHPTLGIVLPQEFITAAEETALILPIGRQVLQQACSHAWSWQQQHRGGVPLIVSVNLSPRQFMQKDLVEQIQEICEQTGLAPTSLKLEITEGMLVQNSELARSHLTELRSLGVRIGIDDFGTGYSSLSYLHNFPIDTLKIDRSFVSGIETEHDKIEIVRTIIVLAHSLGLDVTAEGIETVGQLNILRDLGCECGQGYYFSRPVDMPTTTDLLNGLPHWLSQGMLVR